MRVVRSQHCSTKDSTARTGSWSPAARSSSATRSTTGSSGSTSRAGTARTYATGFDTPVDVERAPNGTLYVADYGNNRVARVVDGRGVTVATGVGANGIAVGPGGTIYLTERLLPRVRALNPATGRIRTIVGSP